MEPEQLAGTTEHSQQAAFFCWAQKNLEKFPELKFMFAIPNGGERNKVTATRLKAEGVKRGVPDVFLPVQRKGCGGLWIEFKRPGTETQKEGRLSPEQQAFKNFAHSEKYGHFVAYNYLQAVECVVSYLS